MKKFSFLLVSLLSIIFYSCSSPEFNKVSDGLELIKIDLSEAREGKLSEFFEPEIEYIWLKDESTDGLIGGDISQILFYNDRIYVKDVYGCKCIQIFDGNGTFLNKIKSFGEGPGQYLEFNDAIFLKEEILLVGVFPRKLMWFGLDGIFLREQKVEEKIGTGAYSDRDKRYYFYKYASEEGEFFVESLNEAFDDTIRSIPFDSERYYGLYSPTSNLKTFQSKVYFGMPFQDTIYYAKDGKLSPKLVFDFGDYGQTQEEMLKMQKDFNLPEQMEFLNNEVKLYFSSVWYITDSQVYLRLRHEKISYDVFYVRKDQKTHVFKEQLVNDLDGSLERNSFFHEFMEGKIGSTISGRDLFKELQRKKAKIGQKDFDEFVKGKGKNFAEAAFAAKDSENPVLIVYTVKQ